MSDQQGRRVIKLGGSLLLRNSLRRDVLNWLSNQPPAKNIVIVGGGKIIDAVRDLDALP